MTEEDIKVLQTLCREEIDRALRFGRKMFKMPIKRPKIVFSKTHKSNGGHYNPYTNTVSLNYWLMVEYAEDFVLDTPAHEAAHCVMFKVHGRKHKWHGAEWKGFMKRIERDEGRCHSFNVADSRKKAGSEIAKNRVKKAKEAKKRRRYRWDY